MGGEPDTDGRRPKRRSTHVALGAGIGMIFGAALGGVGAGVGLVLGAAVGLATEATSGRGRSTRDD